MIKSVIISYLLFILISLSECFVPESLHFNSSLYCSISSVTNKCAVINYNSIYYNEEQQSKFHTGTLALNSKTPIPTISLIDSANNKIQLSCEIISHGGGNIVGPFFCIVPKNFSITEPLVVNYLYEKGTTLTTNGVRDSNVTISFNPQNITSTIVYLKNNTITINGDALLPREGIPTKENGMSIIANFNGSLVKENLDCKVEVDFRQWICKTKYPQFLLQEFEITYSYQYPSELKVTTVKVPATKPDPTERPSSSNSLNSILSFSLLTFFIIILILL
ncbi:hypothetical protein ACTFIV_003113 [Dictyostelium citrinum]